MLRWVTKSRNIIKLVPRQSNFRFFESEAAPSQAPVIQPGDEVKIKKPLPDCCIASRTRPECGVCPRFRYMNIECKVALITEGTTGIGFDIANELLCNEAYRVVLTGSDPEIGAKALDRLWQKHDPERVCFINMNVRKPAEFEYVLNQVAERFGGLDILVNNTKTVDECFWEIQVSLNLGSIIRGTLFGLDVMQKPKKHPGGVIINVASTLSFDPSPVLPVFTGTQHAVASFTQAMGDKEHFNKSNVRVIGICPGPLDISHVPCTQGRQVKERIKARRSKVSVGKSAIYMILYAPSGSIWIVDEEALYRVRKPPRESYQKKITYV